ncbi:histidine kinase [Stutzerimonas nosocomialis]|uniref:histidine kinase n=1 Tax=Stutzerimonas nosocomialis TaxID=1056496 RepID=A0A5R9QAR9_9GAMM|nr:ATP-binding protein [Stutzerimonas nosocomialis]TLX61912.1 histidine kinase [Stutzerimonas nosocomialis]
MRAKPSISWHSLAFVLAFVLLAALAWQGKRTQQSLVHANQTVTHSLELITAIQDVLSSLQDIETGERGFVITGLAPYLKPYETALARLPQERNTLVGLLAQRELPRPDWQQELDRLIDRRLAISAANIQMRRDAGLAAAAERLAGAGGRQTMDALRALLAEAETAERHLLELENRAAEAVLARSRTLALIGSLLVMALFVAALWAIRRSLSIRQRLASAAQAGEARRDALLQAVPDTLYEIDANGQVRCLSLPGDSRTAVPRDIEQTLVPQAQQATERERQSQWRDARGNVFEVRVVPTGLGDHLAIARDVTENQRNRDSLQEQRSFLRKVVDADENLIFVRDDQGRFRLCNRAFAALVGLSPEQIEGRLPAELEHHQRLQPLLEGDTELVEQHVERRYPELHLVDLHGQERWLQLVKRPLQRADGSCQVLAVAVDISARRQMERMKAEFISTVSHELRTPLTAIRGALGMLANGMMGEVEPSMRPLLDIAHKNSERLVRLINDILDIEKLEAGRLTFHTTRNAVLPLVEQALFDIGPYAREYGVSLELARPADDAQVEVDTDRFAQIMDNLLSNAIKHSPAGGTVTVSLRLEQDGLLLTVADRGQGIPDAFKPRIFERFAQADASDARRRGGTGLGLAITRSLVQQMHGEIGFESEQGRGTRFFLRLPVANGSPEHPPQPTPISSQGPGILVIEPDDRAARQLAQILARQGYAPVVTASADEALQVLAERPFQALTLSPALADAEGIAFLQQLRTQAAFRHLPVLVVGLQPQERSTDEGTVRGNAVGVLDWLHKPVDPSRVMEGVRACLHPPGYRPSLLHVEDDADLRELLSSLLAPLDIDLHGAGSLAEAREQLAQRHHDLAILDLMLPDGDGLKLLDELAAARPPTPVIIFSALDAPDTDNRLVLRRLVKSRHHGTDLAALIQQHLDHWPQNPVTPTEENP